MYYDFPFGERAPQTKAKPTRKLVKINAGRLAHQTMSGIDGLSAKARGMDFSSASDRVEPKIANPGSWLTPDPAEAFRHALDLQRDHKYASALVCFEDFVRSYPKASQTRLAKSHIKELKRMIADMPESTESAGSTDHFIESHQIRRHPNGSFSLDWPLELMDKPKPKPRRKPQMEKPMVFESDDGMAESETSSALNLHRERHGLKPHKAVIAYNPENCQFEPAAQVHEGIPGTPSAKKIQVRAEPGPRHVGPVDFKKARAEFLGVPDPAILKRVPAGPTLGEAGPRDVVRFADYGEPEHDWMITHSTGGMVGALNLTTGEYAHQLNRDLAVSIAAAITIEVSQTQESA